MPVILTIMAAGSAQGAENAGARPTGAVTDLSKVIILAQRQSCKSASSCQEAVEMWCGGYRRADADGDGTPCENVCRSRAQVDKIRQEIGC